MTMLPNSYVRSPYVGELGYLQLLRDIQREGQSVETRSGPTKSLFGPQMVFNLSESFPLLTTKEVWLKGIIHELLWFLSGSTNAKDLRKNGVKIWDEWADEETGDLGPIYGKQWRDWGGHYKWSGEKVPGIDQIRQVIESLKGNPYGRRHIVCAWNVGQIDDMALPPCHLLFQFYVRDRYEYAPIDGVQHDKPTQFLDCQLYQRSADMFLGVPFNIASYALLTQMIAQVVGLKPGVFVHTLGDAHIYDNHTEQVNTQCARTPRPVPKMQINPKILSIDDFTYEDFKLLDYHPHKAIPAPVSK